MSASASSSPPLPDLAARRESLQRILDSAFLDRAPNLVGLLRYVCEQSFAGQASSIKEYNVAVEALGRGNDFDQKKDAIVRVEAHRLRKRLADYYNTVGANDPVEICLPPGTYAPRFAFRDVAVEQEPPPGPVVVVADPLPEPGRSVWPLRFGILAVALLVGALVVVLLMRDRPGAARASAESVPPAPISPSAAPADGAVRILCGSTTQTIADRDGVIWSGDRFYTGGTIITSPPRSIARTTTPELYLTRREGDFTYRIPLRPGVYELRLHFAETVFGEGNIAGGGESSRVMIVSANGVDLPISDVLSEAGGPNTATIRVFKNILPGDDGHLTLRFQRVKESAFVNAIEVIPATSARLLPVRIVARSAGFRDAAGQKWISDRYFLGGQPVNRQEAVAGAGTQDLFLGERYGNFTYDIPVDPKGRYSVTLHFTENWFGPGRPGGGGDGSRIFDIHCNGRTLLRNLDVYNAAGGSLRALTKTFHGIEATAQGKIQLSFVPVRNYAMINAIEVVEAGSAQ